MKRWIVVGVLGLISVVLFGVLGVTAERLDSAWAQVPVLTQKWDATKGELSQVRANLESVKAKLIEAEAENKWLRIAPRYTLRDPTYKEMMDFLYADQTDRNRWVKDIYDCKHFSRDVNNSAQEKGFRCAIVIIEFPYGPGHALVAFQTTDQGLVFIEPQNDRKVKVEKGIRYWRDQGEYSDTDDTIVDIVIVW